LILPKWDRLISFKNVLLDIIGDTLENYLKEFKRSHNKIPAIVVVVNHRKTVLPKSQVSRFAIAPSSDNISIGILLWVYSLCGLQLQPCRSAEAHIGAYFGLKKLPGSHASFG